MDQRGARRAPPFAAAVFRWRTVGGPDDKPVELARAQFHDAVLKRYPGYTLSSLRAEDAHSIHQLIGLMDDDLGKAE